jgi:hypothetical protein
MLTLTAAPIATTLVDVPRLLTDAQWRAQLLLDLDDPIASSHSGPGTTRCPHDRHRARDALQSDLLPAPLATGATRLRPAWGTGLRFGCEGGARPGVSASTTQRLLSRRHHRATLTPCRRPRPIATTISRAGLSRARRTTSRSAPMSEQRLLKATWTSPKGAQSPSRRSRPSTTRSPASRPIMRSRTRPQPLWRRATSADVARSASAKPGPYQWPRYRP